MRSMTGFGRAAGTLPDGTEVTILVRGVNHRFLDVAVKLRDELASFEQPIRKAVSEHASRGHVDVLVRSARPAGRGVAFDEEAAARYALLWREAAERRGLPADLHARDLLSLPGVLRTESEGEMEAGGEQLLGLVRDALAEFDATRAREGAALREVLLAILAKLGAGIDRLDEERKGLGDRLAKGIRDRVKKLALETPIDEARLAQEAALLSDRADVSEEIDRFRTHLTEIRRLLDEKGAIGKRLDFLAQELHREANTSGQKVRETPATRAVLELKSEVESFKEQVQNVE